MTLKAAAAGGAKGIPHEGDGRGGLSVGGMRGKRSRGANGTGIRYIQCPPDAVRSALIPASASAVKLQESEVIVISNHPIVKLCHIDA